VRSLALAVSVSMFCAIALVTANAKTERSTSNCEKRCHEYLCSSHSNPMHCKWACHEKCNWEEDTESGDRTKKR
jgi:hypothetical protein